MALFLYYFFLIIVTELEQNLSREFVEYSKAALTWS